MIVSAFRPSVGLLFLLLLAACVDGGDGGARPVGAGAASPREPAIATPRRSSADIRPLEVPPPAPVRPGCGDHRLLVTVETDAFGVGLRVKGPAGVVDLVWSLSGPGLAYAPTPPAPRLFNIDDREAFGIEDNREGEPVEAAFLLLVSGLRSGRRLELEMGQEGIGPAGTRIVVADLPDRRRPPRELAAFRFTGEYRTVELDLCDAPSLSLPAAGEPVLPPRVVAFYYPWWGTTAKPDPPDRCSGDSFGWLAEEGGVRTLGTGHLPIFRDGRRTIYRETVCWQYVRDDHGRRGWIYDVREPRFLAEQMRLAAAHGIDAFAVSTHGDNPEEMAFLERTALPAAEKAGFRIAALYEAPETGWSYDDGTDIAKVGRHLRDIVEILAASPTALTVDRDGRRRVVVFVDVMSLVRFPEPGSWDAVRAIVDDAGVPYFLWSGPGAFPWVFESGFDGVYHDLDVIETLEPPLGLAPYALRDERRLAYRVTVRTARERGLAVALPVVPGWEGFERYRPPDYVPLPRDYGAPGDLGRYYRVRWEDALEPFPDWVVITSWNEWVEGTEVEPSDDHPPSRYDYLEATRRYACRWRDVPGCAR